MCAKDRKRDGIDAEGARASQTRAAEKNEKRKREEKICSSYAMMMASEETYYI